MRIAIDGLPLTQPLTGVGHYTVELARHLALANAADEVSLVTPRRFLSKPQGPQNLHCLRPTLNPLRRVWWRSNLAAYLQKNGVEVFHGTNFELPANANCATVVTIHDLSTLLHPNLHEVKNVERAKHRLPRVAATATLLITPTETIRQEVHEHLGVPLDRIVAIPEAARDCFEPVAFETTASLREHLGVGEKFLLYVGTLEPRKNLLNLVKAFENVCANYPAIKLVMVGGKGWLIDDLFAYVKNSPARERIVFAGYRNDNELRELYSTCTLFLYLSVYEGFGLPPLEAMACGAPVLASAIPSIKEVVGDGARLVATEPEQLTDAICELLIDEKARRELAASGKRRASHFSWAETARRTRDVYGEAIERFAPGK